MFIFFSMIVPFSYELWILMIFIFIHFRRPQSSFWLFCHRVRGVPSCWVSACFRTPRLSLGYPGSLTSVYDLKCMRPQTAPLFNVPRGRRGTTTRVVHPYPCGTSRAGNRTRVVAWGVQSAGKILKLILFLISEKSEARVLEFFLKCSCSYLLLMSM